MMSEICRKGRRFDEIRWVILKTLLGRGRIAAALARRCQARHSAADDRVKG
jgi:hypothetical protein